MSDHLVRRTRSFVKRSAKTEPIVLADGTVEDKLAGPRELIHSV